MIDFSNGQYAQATYASFIIVSGAEAIDFLQSILTANIATIPIGGCRPAALLTPQGRILIDMMVYRPLDNEIYLQTDGTRSKDLLMRLRRYRLRRPVELEVLSDKYLSLWWGYEGTKKPIDASIFLDPRHPDLGCHVVHTVPYLPSSLDGAKPTTCDHWHARRIAQAIPEGAIDLVPERALMLEAGLDKLAAVDFEKGCYIGQEVTARTRYRGLVKRRLLPLRCDGPPPIPGSNIFWLGKVIGTSKTAAPTRDDASQSVVMALLKLEDIHNIIDGTTKQLDAELTIDGLGAQLCPPAWCLPLPNPAAR